MHGPEWLEVLSRSTVVYLSLLVGLRLAGKRHAGQLSPHDFVLILLVSNAVQNAMVGSDVTLAGGLVAAATLILINVLITRFVLHQQRWVRYLAGQPTLLIHNGRILLEALEREGILIDELQAQIRGHGFEGPHQVKSAVEECDGSISVIGFGPVAEYRLPPLRRGGHVRRSGGRKEQEPGERHALACLWRRRPDAERPGSPFNLSE